MFSEIADALTQQIDEITRHWVDELRQSKRTETHKQLLSSEIVNGIKGMLANLAAAIGSCEAPDRETIPIEMVTGELDQPRTSREHLLSTRPLMGPLERAEQSAAAHGKLRHAQGLELQELIFEYVKLRQVIWSTLRAELDDRESFFGVEMVQYLDRLLDELMLISIENFYNTSVRDLESRAIRDPLTQIYNKDYFTQRLNQEMRRAIRYAEPLTIAMIDMDYLKSINDTYGHQVGDAVITAVATAIRDTARQSDVPCRYGGDEFAVILPETTKLQGRAFAERVMHAVQSLTIVVAATSDTPLPRDSSLNDAERDKVWANEGALPILAPVPTLSIGLASFPEDARNPEMLLAKADAALYRAKREGRNRFAC
jgi:diguanylate cyclase (GGDEF)-like protein